MTDNNSQNLEEFAICYESTPGTAETEPQVWMLVTDNSGAINVVRKFDNRRTSGTRDNITSIPHGYHTESTLEVFGLPTANGLGQFLTGALGADSATVDPSGGNVAVHVITPSNTLPSWTVWAKNQVIEQKTWGCQVNRLTLNSPQDEVVTFSVDLVGMDINSGVDDGNFANASYANTSTICAAFTSKDCTVTFLDSGSNLRNTMTDFSATFDNGITVDEGITHGSVTPRDIIAGDREVSGSMTFWDDDADILKAFWSGGDSDPTATKPAECPSLCALTLDWQSSDIEKVIGDETYTNNVSNQAGDLTAAGTYTGTGNTNFNVKILDDAADPEVFQWSTDDGGNWSANVTIDNTGTHTLQNGVTVAFANNSGYSNGDEWSFTAYDYKNKLTLAIPKVRLTNLRPERGGNRLGATVDWTAIKQNSSANICTFTLVSGDTTEYDA